MILEDEGSLRQGHQWNSCRPSDIWCLFQHRENVEYDICQLEMSAAIFWSLEKRINKLKNSHAMSSVVRGSTLEYLATKNCISDII
jgi:hypothetical protein